MTSPGRYASSQEASKLMTETPSHGTVSVDWHKYGLEGQTASPGSESRISTGGEVCDEERNPVQTLLQVEASPSEIFYDEEVRNELTE